MSIKKGLFRLFGSNGNQTVSKVTDSNHQHQQSTIQRIHHRGFLVENTTEGLDSWKAKINGKLNTGDLSSIKESIDWWCDNKTEIAHDKAANQNSSKRKVVVYQGFKLFNDTGEHNTWYMLHNGQLLKGSQKAIEAKIDNAIEKLQRKQR
ncbi:DUF3319 domain-containing protein [Photobacterium sagamiensis]|uniref:DUF3319 domain-containing protein n=1 Tax=Photobacterium sagamiensis TaxID=2910241 RepID=UPI003D115C34